MKVDIRCICPRKGNQIRHPKGDSVTLRDPLPFRGAHAIRWAVALMKESDPNISGPEIMAVLSEQYLLNGVASWTLRDDKGPIEASTANVRSILLGAVDVAARVADVADDLYGPVILPLLTGASTSSPDSPTDESTSPMTTSSDKRPTPLKRSSTTTSPTDSIEATSSGLDGDFSSSPSSVSAA